MLRWDLKVMQWKLIFCQLWWLLWNLSMYFKCFSYWLDFFFKCAESKLVYLILIFEATYWKYLRSCHALLLQQFIALYNWSPQSIRRYIWRFFLKLWQTGKSYPVKVILALSYIEKILGAFLPVSSLTFWQSGYLKALWLA